jgi:hypothetical protein
MNTGWLRAGEGLDDILGHVPELGLGVRHCLEEKGVWSQKTIVLYRQKTAELVTNRTTRHAW